MSKHMTKEALQKQLHACINGARLTVYEVGIRNITNLKNSPTPLLKKAV